jgi:pimeloyl-ACP methyl ester carboxylesterase
MDPPKPGGQAQAELYDDEQLMVRVPARVMWGMQDTALLPGCVEGLERWVPNLDVRHVPDGSHWIVYEKPQLVSETIRNWLI